MEKELLETLRYCQNKLLDIKQVLDEMGIWAEVEIERDRAGLGIHLVLFYCAK